jgi:Rdx family
MPVIATMMTEPVEQKMPTEPMQLSDPQSAATARGMSSVYLPRIVIVYCTQCKWMLRAAYVCVSIVYMYTIRLVHSSSYVPAFSN